MMIKYVEYALFYAVFSIFVISITLTKQPAAWEHYKIYRYVDFVF